ncbi:substrate-binding periplasmic protein [Pseudomonas sp. TUM22785]|uniref:substrate-binding periplasmic protein n=1 Tax=Pseudomonas sp. TUM22785 TaxID=3019098 RepID=UPI002306991B|nr:transporter substrate-binding domain-containing protein [Pseudomonas sp. TUM22785]WCD77589.1 transporter substrate-binding domain-containing protein [Pseudomonas sp. TUM22785]
MRLLSAFLILLLPVLAQADTLRVDLRDRPPEMWSIDGRPTGPLVKVLEVAAERAGLQLEWRYAPFARSLADLREGRIDVVPRVLPDPERDHYLHYLPSIGTQDKQILFTIRPTQRVERYEDLAPLRIGVKRSTLYFPRFDADKALHKQPAVDDDILVRMFRAGRIDTIAVLDKAAIDTAFENIRFSDYTYAGMREPIRVENRFAVSKKLYESDRAAIYDRLGRELEAMRRNGEVVSIYREQGVEPPTP